MQYIIVEVADEVDTGGIAIGSSVTVSEIPATVIGKATWANPTVSGLIAHSHEVSGAVVGATGPAVET